MVAPVRAYSIASAPVAIPPQPMIGIDAGSNGRSVFNALSVIAFNGAPESPPVSALLPTEGQLYRMLEARVTYLI